MVGEHTVTSVGETNPYRTVHSGVFTASAGTLSLVFVKGGTGDRTVLIDDVRIFNDTLELSIQLQEGNVPAIRVAGIPGRMATLEYKNSLAPGAAWQTLTNFTLTSASALVVDNAPPVSNPRFYRAQQVP